MTLRDIQAVTQNRGYVRDERFPGKVTTREVITREWNIVCLAQEGLGGQAPLCSGYRPANASLDAEQRQAVGHILSSRDFVTLFRGGAGTGKSFALREVQGALKRAGRTVQVLVPQRQQVTDLERDGFAGAQTVSAFLARCSMPRGAVVLVDEAGQIGGEQMLQLLQFVKENEGRVVLSGDTRQHGAIQATDALRAIEKYSGLQTVDYVLFSDSSVKAATNEHQWYVTISRGRKGIQIFTADKIQLRQNVARSGDRTLALDIARPEESFAHRVARIWKRDLTYVLDVRRSQRESAQRQAQDIGESESVKPSEAVSQSQTIRQTRTIVHKQHQTQRYGRGGIGRAVEFIKLVPGRYFAAAENEAGFVETIAVEASGERN